MIDDTFGFIFHPIQIKKDVKRKYPILGTILPEPLINWACQYFPPQYISEITGITSADTGKAVRGWFVAAPYTPPMMMSLPEAKVYQKIIQTAQLAQRLGAKIVGLGAFTSVVGDAGKSIADAVDIPVTTGDSYTVAVAVDALLEAARVMDIAVSEATIAVVGATGAIGKACALLLAESCAELIVVGRRADATEQIREQCEGSGAALLAATTMDAIYTADLVLTVSSAINAIVEPQHLKPGAVVLDVARPRDVSAAVAAQRDDVLVIEGGMVDVPGQRANFNFDFGFPPGKAFACMAETIALALEGRYEDYTIGRDIAVAQVKEIREICTRHGFRLSGFRAFEHAVTQATIDAVRERAVVNRKMWHPVLT